MRADRRLQSAPRMFACFRFVLASLVFLAGLAVARRAAATDCHATPAVYARERAVVRIDARGATTLGVVVANPTTVVAPLDAIEDAFPGEPDAWVLDHAGRRHAARLVSTAPTSRIALLRTSEPLDAEPFWGTAVGDATCSFVVTGDTSSGPIEYQWSSDGRPAPGEPHRWALEGSPILDERGDLVGLVTSTEGSLSGKKVAPAAVLRDLAESPRPLTSRRAIHAFYMQHGLLQGSDGGGVWGGISFGGAVRVHHTIELRLDGGLTFLLPSRARATECHEPPCFAGVRGVVSPSLGARLYVGGPRALPVALTASFGVAVGAQVAYARDGASSQDVAAPNLFVAAAPSAGVAFGPFEARARWLVTRAEQRAGQPMIGELSLGVVF